MNGDLDLQDGLELAHRDLDLLSRGQEIQPATEPSPLRLTLAPAAPLEGSPATPHRRRPFTVPDLSPAGQDPLPALYPAFPELGYPPYSPPAYSSHPMYEPYTFSPAPRDRERVREHDERRVENHPAQQEGNGNGEAEARAGPSPRKRRPPPPAAHIVRAPKHLKDQLDARMHQRA
jgi:hypothetical protein